MGCRRMFDVLHGAADLRFKCMHVIRLAFHQLLTHPCEIPSIDNLQTEERMTQDNEPIAPKESAWKYSRWGIISFVIFILWLFMIFICMSGPHPHIPQAILNVGGVATVSSPIVETIFAVIGLFRDRKRPPLLHWF